MSYSISATGMNMPDVLGMPDGAGPGKTAWHEDDADFKNLIRELENYHEAQGTVFRIEDYFAVKNMDGKKYYVARSSILQTAKRVFSHNIDVLEKRAMGILNRMNGGNELFGRITDAIRALASAGDTAGGGPVRIDIKSGQYTQLKRLLDDMNERNGTDYRLEDFGAIKNIDGRTYFEFDKGKLSGEDGLPAVLQKASDAIGGVKPTDLLEYKRVWNQIQVLYKLWSNVVQAVGKALEEVNRSTHP